MEECQSWRKTIFSWAFLGAGGGWRWVASIITQGPRVPIPLLKKKKKCLFIWLHWVLLAAYGTFGWVMWDLVPWPGIKPGPLHWELGILAIGPTGKSPSSPFLTIEFHSDLSCQIREGFGAKLVGGSIFFKIRGRGLPLSWFSFHFYRGKAPRPCDEMKQRFLGASWPHCHSNQIH